MDIEEYNARVEYCKKAGAIAIDIPSPWSFHPKGRVGYVDCKIGDNTFRSKLE